jgi:hypothetical protein
MLVHELNFLDKVTPKGRDFGVLDLDLNMYAAQEQPN